MNTLRQILAIVVAGAVLSATSPKVEALPAPAPQQQQQENLTPMEIDAIVSPIALYPDQLIAQILGAATYPDQVQAADNFVNGNRNLQGDALMQAVDGQPWDPSVKALTQFPSVLDQMAQNLGWTSSLGDASYNQQADVMASIQRLRQQAKNAGNLKSTSQVTVVQQSPQTIVIQPANPQVVYVPQYNPTVVYGVPYSPPGYSTAALVTTGLISFGLGIAVGAAISNNHCCGWGWGGGGWGMNWHGGNVVYQHNTYISRSTTFYGPGRYNYRNTYYGGNRPQNNYYNANNRYNGGGNRYNGGNNRNVSGNTINNININTGGNTNVNNNRPNTNINNNNRPNNNIPNNNIPNNNRPNNNPGTNNRPNNNVGNNRGGGAGFSGQQNDRGFGQQGQARNNSSAFSGGNRGGNTVSSSERGRQSMGAQSRQAAPERGSGGGRKR